MIYQTIPYSTEKNLGKYYNDFARLVTNPDDYILYIDGDAMFTTHFWGHQIKDIIAKYPECDLFTSVTNRIGTPYQCVDGMWEENDISKHWQKGKQLYDSKYSECLDITNNAPIGGVLMLLKKSSWIKAEGFEEKGMLGIDNSIHYRIRDYGGKIMIMKGVYILHYYRNGDMANKQHLL